MDERQSQDNNEINLSKLLPVMGYSLTSMRPDSTSRLNPKNEYTLSSGYIYTPVPYDFTFELYVWTKSINHMFQILEQCCVFFKPNYCTTIKEVPAFGSIGYSDVDITLDDITFGNTVEFDEEGWRALESTLTFTLKGNLYPAITNQGDIEEIRIRMRNMGATEEQDQYIETLLTEYDSDTQTTTQSVIVEAGL
jgi:hypothetical protein